MTAAVGQAFPGVLSRPSKGGVAAGKDKGSDFSEMLRTPGSDKSQPKEAGPRGAIWEKSPAPHAAVEAGQTEMPAAISLPETWVGKTGHSEANAPAKEMKDAQDGEDENKESGPSKDGLPLLITLQGLQRLSPRAQADGGRAPTEPAGRSTQAHEAGAGGAAAEQSLAIAGVASAKGAGSAEAGSAKSADAAISQGRPGENVPPRRPLDLPPPPGIAIAQSRTSQTHGAPESRRVEPESLIARTEPERQKPLVGPATVLGHQSTPAPVLPTSQTAVHLAGSIASSGGWQVLSTPAAYSTALPAQSLKIELHPAELGTVTANLRLAGGQLSIELKPETHDAHRKLSSDSDAIVASLRGLGFDVDKVTVLQPAIAAHASARGDAVGSQAGQAGRDQSGFQPGGSGNGGGAGGQQSGRSFNESRQEHARPSPRDRAGGDLFI